MNWFPFHIGDHYKRTAHLSACEEGIYVRLSCLYLQDGPFGEDLKAIQRKARARSKEERAALGVVLEEAFTFDSEARVWRSKECDELIRTYQEKSAKAQQSAKARWSERSTDANASKSHQPSDSEGNANASKSHAAGNANQEPEARAPISRSQSPISKNQTADRSDGAASVSGESTDDTQLPDMRTVIGSFDGKSTPSKSPQSESRKPQNALEFEQINDRVERVLVELDLQGSPVNQHDYAQIASLSGLTEKQVRKAVEQLVDRRRLPIAERRRAAS